MIAALEKEPESEAIHADLLMAFLGELGLYAHPLGGRRDRAPASS
jgi:hypothetical protein